MGPRAPVLMLTDSLMLVVAYVLGSIPVAWLVVRRLTHLDVRRIGSGNVGATNALRATSPAIGLLVALADAGKGALAIWIARRAHASDTAVALAAVAAVAGHVAPVWLKFRGGKGVATASGAFAVLAPLAAGVALAVFGAVVWATRLVSLGSLAATLALVGTAAWHDPARVAEAAGLAGLIIVARHSANITRLRAGTERPLLT
jgi:glycerol-3-phosphate acyltransferase PlsY